MTTSTQSTPAQRWSVKLQGITGSRVLGIPLPVVALSLIVLLGAFLRLWQLGAAGDGNQYYAAAVKSMLTSWHNFFFISADPGGSVTVDKPPLGFWLQAISAMIFGVNGFALALPEALAGIFGIPLLYHLVKRYFGQLAGLIAALAIAITPIAIAAERNNTIDGTLVFALLLAAWAFIRATNTGKLRYLWLGAVFVGLAFNIKMLEAFLPLPAFYGLYLLGAKTGLRRKIVHLVAATAIILAISFSWAIAVDLTPADQRPYIGSSGNNSVVSLILGYNGVQRLLGMSNGPGSTSGNGGPGNGAPANFTPPSGTLPNGQPPPFMTNGTDGAAGAPNGGPNGANGFMNTGTRGVLRMFQQPLAKEASWLLPLALLGLAVIALRKRLRFPLGKSHQALILWGGWAVTGVVFFSVAGFFHPYYLIILAPPLAALVGITLSTLWDSLQKRPLLTLVPLVAMTGVTLGFQVITVNTYAGTGWWLGITVAVAMAGGVGLFVAATVLRTAKVRTLITRVAATALMGAVFITPGLWSLNTTLDANPNGALPESYAGQTTQNGQGTFNPMTGSANEALVTYLQAHTSGQRYMLAVSSSMTGSPYVLKTGRGVLMMGGFNGQDEVVTADQLSTLVKKGDLTYVLADGSLSMSKPAISTWLQKNCTTVDGDWGSTSNFGPRGMGGGSTTLYECKVAS